MILSIRLARLSFNPVFASLLYIKICTMLRNRNSFQNMKMPFFIISITVLILISCKKTDVILTKTDDKGNLASEDFTTYTIKQGEHYCDGSALLNVEYEALNFIVKFDSSAIYKTKNAVNQADINKLYGFSDNMISITSLAQGLAGAGMIVLFHFLAIHTIMAKEAQCFLIP